MVGDYSTAMGIQTEAIGLYSTAMGYLSKAMVGVQLEEVRLLNIQPAIQWQLPNNR